MFELLTVFYFVLFMVFSSFEHEQKEKAIFLMSFLICGVQDSQSIIFSCIERKSPFRLNKTKTWSDISSCQYMNIRAKN